MKPVTLPDNHYASGWKTEGSLRPVAEVNELGRKYALTRDQDTLLEICRCFHPYLMKYLVMICRGHLPVNGVGRKASHVNSDSRQFIRYFLPKGAPINKQTMLTAVLHFHLAFKGMEVDEVYDVLMEQLVAAVNGYDPDYKSKIRKWQKRSTMSYRNGSSSQGMTSTGTWTLIAIAIFACCAALVSSRKYRTGKNACFRAFDLQHAQTGRKGFGMIDGRPERREVRSGSFR
jgi:hypothetical protein